MKLRVIQGGVREIERPDMTMFWLGVGTGMFLAVFIVTLTVAAMNVR